MKTLKEFLDSPIYLDIIDSQNFSWELKERRGRKTMIGSPMWG